jgi:hypothetical protein
MFGRQRLFESHQPPDTSLHKQGQDIAFCRLQPLIILGIALVGIEGLRRKLRADTYRIPISERQNVAGAPMLRRTRQRWEQSRV